MSPRRSFQRTRHMPPRRPPLQSVSLPFEFCRVDSPFRHLYFDGKTESFMVLPMRTTVTLEPDVERALKEQMRRHNLTFKQALNDAVRKGLAEETVYQRHNSFVVKARPMGLRPGLDPAKLTDFAADLDVEAFLATTAKLSKHEE